MKIQLTPTPFSFLSADFEFDRTEIAYREKVLKNLEDYIHEIFPGEYLNQTSRLIEKMKLYTIHPFQTLNFDFAHYAFSTCL